MVIDWSSDEGVKRLEQSKHKADFFKLANNFEGQTNKIFCGPTSAAIVLNALRVREANQKLPEDSSLLQDKDKKNLPQRKSWTPFYERYSQNNVFLKSPKKRSEVLGQPLRNKKGKILKNKEGKPKKDFGFQIRQFAALLEGNGLKTKLRVVGPKLSNETIKSEFINNLKTKNDYIIANYKRTVLKQPGGGHISPVAAYHKNSDSFLVLDVTPNKANWVWVDADLFISAMRTFDTIENRGYVLISEG